MSDIVRFVCGLIFVPSLVSVIALVQQDPGPFSKLYYQGPPYKAVIAIYYKKNYKQPECYGTLINFDVAVAPCSCFIRNKLEVAPWWDHSNKNKMESESPEMFEALVMTHEHQNNTVKNMMMTSLKEIHLSPKCDAIFQYNIARIVLKKPIGRTKLAWVASPFEDKMKELLEYAQVGAAVRGECVVYQWKVYNRSWWRRRRKLPRPRIAPYEVTLMHWSFCKGLVCSQRLTPNNQKINHDSDVCDNNVSKSRICVHWEAGHSFCSVVPGTPVFCSAGPMIGLAGFVHSMTQWCPPEVPVRYAVMEGINLALPLIKYDMRLINVLNEKLTR